MAAAENGVGRPIALTIVMTSVVPAESRYWANIITALQGAGFRVRVLTVPGRFLLRAQDHRYMTRYMRNPVVVSPRLIRELLRHPSDYVMAIEYGMATVWCIVAGRIGRARVLIFQENRRPSPVQISWGRRVYQRILALMADGVIANTQTAEQQILSELRIAQHKVTRITLLCPPTVQELTEQKNPVEEPIVRPLFLFVGQLIARKNVETLLRAARLLRDKGLAFALWIVGDGPLQAHLSAMTRDFHLEDVVTFLGPIPYPSIGHIYGACDVFVIPSRVDYRSVAVLEAMRFGKPILASQFDGNVGDTVRSGYNGYVFDPRRPEELADQMATLIINPDLRQAMGARSKELMDEQTPALAAAQLSRLLRQWLPNQATRS